MRKFDINTQFYTKSGQIDIPDNCNGVTFTNVGADTVIVDQRKLYPGTVGSIQGDSITIGGNEGEIYAKRTATISFLTETAPNLEVTFKYYIK